MKKIITLAVALNVAACFAVGAFDDAGGYVEVLPKDAGHFVFCNSQQGVPAADIQKVIGLLHHYFHVDIRLASGDAPTVSGVQDALKSFKAKGAIWIVSDAHLPLVLAATENQWAFINVFPVLADSPDEKTRKDRMACLILRTFASIHGVGAAYMMPACVMNPAVGIKGLDALTFKDYSPEAIDKVQKYLLGYLGYKAALRGSYEDACIDGWAPQPTNSVQKAIWDKVHAMPTQPIKILPESQRK